MEPFPDLTIVPREGTASASPRLHSAADAQDGVSLAVVMPMAGRGIRFQGYENKQIPKPLIELRGRPLFWWAMESIRRHAVIREQIFVVLAEHVAKHHIDQKILESYPEAKIVTIARTTNGAAETAEIGVDALITQGPLAVNDCDHAFQCTRFPDLGRLLRTDVDGALLSFPSTSPEFSYLALSPTGGIVGTAEKRIVSPYAIGGCYLFSDQQLFHRTMHRYRQVCRDDELYISGLFDCLIKDGARIEHIPAENYSPLGTPTHVDKVKNNGFRPFSRWV